MKKVTLALTVFLAAGALTAGGYAGID